MRTGTSNYAAILARACSKEVASKEIAKQLWYSLYQGKQLGNLDQIFIEARALLSQQKNEVCALVTSATPLSPSQITEIKQILARDFKETIILENIIDKSLGAGVEIKIANKVYDYSLSGRILGLHKILKEKYEIQST